MHKNEIQSPEIKALISQVAEANRLAANLNKGIHEPEGEKKKSDDLEKKLDDSDPPKSENKCDYIPGKLVAGPNVSHGLNNSG